MTRTSWIVKINTNSYAGNFEREMCAYCTGHIGDCGVGNDYVDECVSDAFCDTLDFIPDEFGCYRPCSIGVSQPTPHDFPSNYSVLIHFQVKPDAHQLGLIRRLAKEFPHADHKGHDQLFKDIKVLSFELIKVIETRTEISHPWIE